MRKVLLSVLALLALSPCVHAAVPTFVTYSGRLTDGTGWGQSDEVALTFRIYGQAEGGDALWEQTFPCPTGIEPTCVAIEDGYFSVILGDGEGPEGALNVTAVFAGDPDTWISVQVGPDGPELERQKVGSVPYAVQARTVHQPKLAPGETHNLGWYRSADGVISINAADGSELSEENTGFVRMPSRFGSPGGFVTLRLTAPVMVRDGDSDESDFAGRLFGVTGSVPWTQWMPFFIYALNRNDTDAGLAFGLSRNPTALAFDGPLIGYFESPPQEDEQGAVFVFRSQDVGDYPGAPAQLVGATMMKKPSDVDDWVLMGSQNGRGFGPAALQTVTSRMYLMAMGQNGNAPGKNFAGSAAPGSTTQLSFAPSMGTWYSIAADGDVEIHIFDNSQETATSESDYIVWYLPYKGITGYTWMGSTYFRIGGMKKLSVVETSTTNGYAIIRNPDDDLTSLQLDDFSYTSDYVNAHFRYRAFEE